MITRYIIVLSMLVSTSNLFCSEPNNEPRGFFGWMQAIKKRCCNQAIDPRVDNPVSKYLPKASFIRDVCTRDNSARINGGPADTCNFLNEALHNTRHHSEVDKHGSSVMFAGKEICKEQALSPQQTERELEILLTAIKALKLKNQASQLKAKNSYKSPLSPEDTDKHHAENFDHLPDGSFIKDTCSKGGFKIGSDADARSFHCQFFSKLLYYAATSQTTSSKQEYVLVYKIEDRDFSLRREYEDSTFTDNPHWNKKYHVEKLGKHCGISPEQIAKESALVIATCNKLKGNSDK